MKALSSLVKICVLFRLLSYSHPFYINSRVLALLPWQKVVKKGCNFSKKRLVSIFFHTNNILTCILFMPCGCTIETLSILAFTDWPYSLTLKVPQCNPVFVAVLVFVFKEKRKEWDKTKLIELKFY